MLRNEEKKTDKIFSITFYLMDKNALSLDSDHSVSVILPRLFIIFLGLLSRLRMPEI